MDAKRFPRWFLTAVILLVTAFGADIVWQDVSSGRTAVPNGWLNLLIKLLMIVMLGLLAICFVWLFTIIELRMK